jgi:hypothetical protein
MEEEEFDALMQPRPFGSKDAMMADVQLRRSMTLGIALWGSTLDDLRRQLLAPSPEVPPGFELADFRELQRSALEISAGLRDPRFALLSQSHLASSSHTIVLGIQHFTPWEARCEIVRRAIEYLEKH